MPATTTEVTVKVRDLQPVRDELAALRRVREALRCSQCGQTLSDRACGPTHALLVADPSQHVQFTKA